MSNDYKLPDSIANIITNENKSNNQGDIKLNPLYGKFKSVLNIQDALSASPNPFIERCIEIVNEHSLQKDKEILDLKCRAEEYRLGRLAMDKLQQECSVELFNEVEKCKKKTEQLLLECLRWLYDTGCADYTYSVENCVYEFLQYKNK